MNKPNTELAKSLGAEAFARGVKCAPCLDQNLVALISGRKVGDKRTSKEMKSWSNGWIQASLLTA